MSLTYLEPEATAHVSGIRARLRSEPLHTSSVRFNRAVASFSHGVREAVSRPYLLPAVIRVLLPLTAGLWLIHLLKNGLFQ